MRLRQIAFVVLAASAAMAGSSPADAQNNAQAAAAPASAPASFAAHPAFAQSQVMLTAHQSGNAYDLLSPLEATFAGDPDFDYLFGVACLDSGRASLAVFSLQRVVANNPAFVGARLDLARAYYDAGDNDDARREFSLVSAQNPPASAAEAISQYQTAIDRRTGDVSGALRTAIEVSAGEDSNANAGTDSESFLGIPLNKDSRTADSLFFGAAGRLGYVRALSPNLRWQAGGFLRHREYPDASFVTNTVGQVSSGLGYGTAQSFVALDLSARTTILDGKKNLQVLAADFSGEVGLGAQISLAGSLRLAQLRYPNELDVLDVDQTIAGLALRWRPANSSRHLELSAGPIFGREKARTSGSVYGRDLSGGRVAASAIAAGVLWRGSVGLLQSDYDGVFIAGKKRKDDQFTASLDVDVPRVFGDWLLRPSLSYIDNSSSEGLTLFEYDRLELGLALVRAF